ncbi:MAG: hypothetical protein HYZ58_09745, partial [Acidobacteria bacterium]|nr:hypothetical protein [Acidobacteriota bacterium]
ALAFGAAAGLFFAGFCRLGAPRALAALAVLGWIFYLPHGWVFGYYYAEPFLALSTAVLFVLVARTASKPTLVGAATGGAVAAVLLLSRAPYVAAVGALVLLLAWHLKQQKRRYVGLFVAAFLAFFFPWTIRNLLAYGELIPFTTDAGLVLFQGTYLPGDDGITFRLREIPEFRRLEEQQQGKDPITQMHAWRALALQQIRANPIGQLRLCLRKAIRFWTYLPEHSWVPSWKTGLIAGLCLPLALIGVLARPQGLLVQLCAIFAGGLWLVHGLVHAELRYNFPVLPMLFMLAAQGGRVLAGHFTTGGSRLLQSSTR